MIILNEKVISENYGIHEAIDDVTAVLLAKSQDKISNPLRTVIEFPHEEASVLYMPSADLEHNIMTMKAVTIFPNNPQRNLPTTQGVVLVSSAENGEHLALLNASYLTRLRTGALSGIATNILARKDASVLTVIGTGAMAFEQVLGVLAVRAITQIYLVNPTLAKAQAFKERLRSFGVAQNIAITIETDVSVATRKAHIINCSTRSQTPVFNGMDVQAGTHVNGVGSYLPHMREVDHTFISACHKIVVDDYHGATEEAGELIYANTQNDWSFEAIYGELKDLVSDTNFTRKDSEITFFKCVGAAYFDLAVAAGVYHKAKNDKLGIEVDV